MDEQIRIILIIIISVSIFGLIVFVMVKNYIKLSNRISEIDTNYYFDNDIKNALLSFIRDKKRVIPCASLCEGEFDINGYFIGVPTVIGSNGVEKILTFELNEEEKNALENTLSEVKKTVEETGL